MATTPENLKKVACSAIDKSAADLADVSSAIWGTPELKMEEHFAHKTLSDFLEKHGFPVERHYGLETGFCSVYGESTDKSKRLPNIAVLCEYDALPDIGHACGHNLIAEVGVAAALGIKAALETARDAGQSLGLLTVLGTPGEEGGGGKVDMINVGAFNKVDAAMMAHPFPVNGARADNILAITSCSVKYIGKASHAAAFPWEGVNALDAAVMAYTNVSVLRQQLKPSWRVHGVITNGGAKPNIIPELTEMEYYIRAPTQKELDLLVPKVVNCFEAAAKATGCTVEVQWEEKPYKDVITNSTLVGLYEQNAECTGYVPNDSKPLALGSTDMGNVSYVVPSIHPFFYIGGEAFNHTREFTSLAGDPKAQPYTIDVAKALAMTAIDVYCHPELVKLMWTELKQDLK